MTNASPSIRPRTRPGAPRRRRPALLVATAVLVASVLTLGGAPASPGGDAAFADPLRSRLSVTDAAGSPPSSLASPRTAGPTGDLVAFEDWTWPTMPPILVETPFRAPPTPYAAGHRGVDLRANAGEPVRAPADGIVSFAGAVAGRPVVSIDHGGGVLISLEPVAANVAKGDLVDAGTAIGAVSAGGHCDDHCVHLGVRLHGEYVSPMLYLGGVPLAVLLPQ